MSDDEGGHVLLTLSQMGDPAYVQETILTKAAMIYDTFAVERLKILPPVVVLPPGGLGVRVRVGFTLDPDVLPCPLCEGSGIIKKEGSDG